MQFLRSLKARARELKQFTLVAYYAARDPRTPVVARVLALLVAAYALSPIDLIPDFIPVLGYLDDIVLVPLGLALVIRLLPDDVLAPGLLARGGPPHQQMGGWGDCCRVVACARLAWPLAGGGDRSLKVRAIPPLAPYAPRCRWPPGGVLD